MIKNIVIYSVNPITSNATITDNYGNIYTATTVVDSTINFAVTKTLANQNLDWQFSLDGWNKGIDSAKVITADAAGYLYAAGKAWNGYEFNLVTAKLNSVGEPVWTAFYNFHGFDATPVGIRVDSNFIVSVYTQISDSTTNDYALIKYSQCDTSCVFRISNAFANAQLNVIKDVVNFYPNPANNLLTVEYSLNGNNCKIQLIDIIGRVVVNKQLNPGSNRLVLDIEHLTSGIYSVVITNGDKIEQVDKLAIVR